jgi:hypothetical protein
MGNRIYRRIGPRTGRRLVLKSWIQNKCALCGRFLGKHGQKYCYECGRRYDREGEADRQRKYSRTEKGKERKRRYRKTLKGKISSAKGHRKFIVKNPHYGRDWKRRHQEKVSVEA